MKVALTSFCERLVSSVLDATEKLPAVHAVNKQTSKQTKRVYWGRMKSRFITLNVGFDAVCDR